MPALKSDQSVVVDLYGTGRNEAPAAFSLTSHNLELARVGIIY
jgi:hypothetical protein